MSNTLRTAVVGVRGVGRGHVQTVAAHPRADLVVVADLDPDAASAAAEPHGARAFDGLDRMLAEAPELDAIILATPHHLHAPMSLRALEQGLHVYVEKPIATRISDADRIVAAAADAERVLAVGHQYRTFRGNLRLKQIIDGGELGQVQRVVWQWLEARPETYYARDPWRCRWAEAGGGVLLNQASHDIDLLCWLFGPASEVSATVGERTPSTSTLSLKATTRPKAWQGLRKGSPQSSTTSPVGSDGAGSPTSLSRKRYSSTLRELAVNSSWQLSSRVPKCPTFAD